MSESRWELSIRSSTIVRGGYRELALDRRIVCLDEDACCVLVASPCPKTSRSDRNTERDSLP